MVIGIDLGGMSAKATVFENGKIFDKVSVRTSADDSPETTAKNLVQLCKNAAEAAGVSFDEIEAIGIGAPGIIDSSIGEVVMWTNFHWENVPLASLMQKQCGKKIFVLNDANAAAYGEAKFGAGADYDSSILITIGTGVGGGIILDNKLFEGYKSAGTEIGHMVIRLHGEPCTCGRCGCLERYASTKGLIKHTREAMEKHPESIMWKFAPNLDDVGGRTVFYALKEGDETAQEVYGDFIAALGEGVSNLVNILRPQAIIIGGGISAEGETLLKPLRKYVHEHIYVAPTYAALDILKATLGNDAGLYGAAQFALEHI